jgi:site-specific DNA-methyltransferase (cytosine-N4-specific)
MDGGAEGAGLLDAYASGHLRPHALTRRRLVVTFGSVFSEGRLTIRIGAKAHLTSLAETHPTDGARTESAAPKVIAAELPTGLAYQTHLGAMYKGKAEELLPSPSFAAYRGKVQLIFSSPPFPLNRKKKYGNKQGREYVAWLARMAPLFKQLLTPNGSIVLEMGNAWEPGKPVMSVLALRALLAFMKRGDLYLCQQFICDNPARLPGPVEWVNKLRIRVKDSFTHVWWLSPVERPKADNKRVLKPYSKAMHHLLDSRQYNPGKRPSGHLIGRTSFFQDNGGAIPSNYLSFANTKTNDPYQEYCRKHEMKPHPARMPIGLAEFFIKFLTDEGDIVLDPFGGSNTTGAASESLNRHWLAVEARDEYIIGSRARFPSLQGEGHDSGRAIPSADRRDDLRGSGSSGTRV